MKQSDINKTEFSINPLRRFEFRVLPFGLRNSPRTFQRVLNTVLGELIGKICFVFIDDISSTLCTKDAKCIILGECDLWRPHCARPQRSHSPRMIHFAFVVAYTIFLRRKILNVFCGLGLHLVFRGLYTGRKNSFCGLRTKKSFLAKL